jgi:hypothetical protein
MQLQAVMQVSLALMAVQGAPLGLSRWPRPPCCLPRRDAGLIGVKTRWKEYAAHVTDEEAYRAVEANGSGSRPKVTRQREAKWRACTWRAVLAWWAVSGSRGRWAGADRRRRRVTGRWTWVLRKRVGLGLAWT